MINENNTTTATGALGELVYDHTILGEDFFTSILSVKRLSGAVDEIPVTIPGKLAATADLAVNVTITGQLRSYNKLIDDTNRLIITLFAQQITPAMRGDDTQNSVRLTGTLCKQPIYRLTPFGREICDFMLAVNRGFGKSDYIPCITWGRNGQWASHLSVGQRVTIKGRLQSRQYNKLLDSGECEPRTAYEVSAFSIERAEPDKKVI